MENGKCQKGESRCGCECECEFWRAPTIRQRILATKSRTKSFELSPTKEFAMLMRMVLRMKLRKKNSLQRKIPCEWKFATTFASDCECDGFNFVRSGCIFFGADWGYRDFGDCRSIARHCHVSHQEEDRYR